MTVDQGLFPPDTKVRFVRGGLPFVGRVIEDDPENGRAKVRAETQLGVMHTRALSNVWIAYEHLHHI